jgi:hypothetical protein
VIIDILSIIIRQSLGGNAGFEKMSIEADKVGLFLRFRNSNLRSFSRSHLREKVAGAVLAMASMREP